MGYDRRNHSKYRLMVHLIFVTKYRLKLLDRYGSEIKTLFVESAKSSEFHIDEMEVDRDHVHLMVLYPPKVPVTDIVRHSKQKSTYHLWRQNNKNHHLSTVLWKDQTFWSDGYFVAIVGEASEQTITDYIRQQG